VSDSLEQARAWIGANREVIDGWSEQLEEGAEFAPRLAALLDQAKAEAREAERERCAALCEAHEGTDGSAYEDGRDHMATTLTQRIRALSGAGADPGEAGSR